MPTIFFENKDQQILWQHELVGQISDGMWENSMPYDHWEYWSDCDTDIALNHIVPGVYHSYFRPRKTGYRFTALIEHIGDRMIGYVRMSRLTTNRDLICAGEYLLESNLKTLAEVKHFIKHNDYTKPYLKSLTQDLIDKFWSINYMVKDLRKDLVKINKIIKNINYLR